VLAWVSAPGACIRRGGDRIEVEVPLGISIPGGDQARREFARSGRLELHAVEPLVREGAEERRLLGPQAVARPIEDRERRARTRLEEVDRVEVADVRVLAAREDERGPIERLREATDVDRQRGAGVEPIEERVVGDPETRQDAGTCSTRVRRTSPVATGPRVTNGPIVVDRLWKPWMTGSHDLRISWIRRFHDGGPPPYSSSCPEGP
jgi:hypothetical protein